MKRRIWGMGSLVAAGLAAVAYSGCGDSESEVVTGGTLATDVPSASGDSAEEEPGPAEEAMEAVPFNGQPFDPGDTTPRPSAGCGSPLSVAVGNQFLDRAAEAGKYILTPPTDYDVDTPYPVFFVFHGANNTEGDCRGGGNCRGVARALEGHGFVVYQKAVGNSWTTEEERAQNVANFDQILDRLAAGSCIDEGRVTAMGTSSGAHFTNILACRRGDRLQAAVPGAGELFETDGCVGEVAALVIHGIDDMGVPVGLGEAARDAYAERNGCSGETSPPLGEVRASVREARTAEMDLTVCATYSGCRPGLAVRWCEHSVPGYDGSTHGWPPSGGPLALEFATELVGAEAE